MIEQKKTIQEKKQFHSGCTIFTFILSSYKSPYIPGGQDWLGHKESREEVSVDDTNGRKSRKVSLRHVCIRDISIDTPEFRRVDRDGWSNTLENE